MKKEDFYGKWILRFGDLLPEEINVYSWPSIGLTIKLCDYLQGKGLLFDSMDEAKKASDNAVALIRGIKNGTYVREEDIAEAYPAKPRIYISGPISGHDLDERRKAFKEVQWMLEAQGYEVFNPMENGLPAEATTHEHMRIDIENLLKCDHIFMMRRWTHSKGCKVEFDVATAIGIPVIIKDSGYIIKFE